MTAAQRLELLEDVLRDLVPVAERAYELDGFSDTWVEGDYSGRIERARAVIAGAEPCDACGFVLCLCDVGQVEDEDEGFAHDRD